MNWSWAVTVVVNGRPAVTWTGALTVKWVAAAALTLIGPLVPVMEKLLVSVAVMVWLPAVRSVAVRDEGVVHHAQSRLDELRIDPVYFRPTEVDLLIGDSSKARAKLGWKPKTTLQGLVKEMMAADLVIARREAANGKDSV